MTGHLKLYACLCSESADHADWVPDECTGHQTPTSGSIPNLRPGPMAAGHTCPDLNRCVTPEGTP